MNHTNELQRLLLGSCNTPGKAVFRLNPKGSEPGLPTNKLLKLLTLKGVGSVADGGTQVKSTSEVGHISILPIEKKDGVTLVRYRIN